LEGVVAAGDVGEDFDGYPVGGDRRSARRLEQSAGVSALPVRLVAVLLEEGGVVTIPFSFASSESFPRCTTQT
jgi:hypothetical protein